MTVISFVCSYIFQRNSFFGGDQSPSMETITSQTFWKLSEWNHMFFFFLVCLFPVQEFKSSFINCHVYEVALRLPFPPGSPSLPSSSPSPAHPHDFHHSSPVLICTPHLLPCNWPLLCVWYLKGQGKNNERNVRVSFLCLIHSHQSWVSALSLDLVKIHK